MESYSFPMIHRHGDLITPVPPKESSYILYLHPIPGNPAYDQMKEFWSELDKLYSENVLNWNLALGYPFHVTLTSFFKTDLETLDKLRQNIISLFPEDLPSCSNFKLKNTDKLIAIAMESNLNDKLKQLNKEFPFLILKDNLHLSLAHEFKDKDRSLIEEAIDAIINLSEWKIKPFKVALWERKADNSWIQLT